MTLSIVSNAAGHGRLLGYGLAGLPPLASVAEAQRPDAARPWSYTPPSAKVGHSDARSGLLAVLSRFPADPYATARARASRSEDDIPGSWSGSPARSDDPDLLRALSVAGGAPSLPAALPLEHEASEQAQQPLRVAARRPSTEIASTLQVGLPLKDVPADPSISAADAQLQALFKTLQAYGL